MVDDIVSHITSSIYFPLFSSSEMSIIHSSSYSHWPIFTRHSSKLLPLLAKVATVATATT